MGWRAATVGGTYGDGFFFVAFLPAILVVAACAALLTLARTGRWTVTAISLSVAATLALFVLALAVGLGG